jgi:hypothetical protein
MKILREVGITVLIAVVVNSTPPEKTAIAGLLVLVSVAPVVWERGDEVEVHSIPEGEIAH